MLPAGNEDLTEDELDDLEHFLNDESGLSAPMCISEIDGLLTAVMIGPVFPSPSQWLPLIWGDDEEPEFVSQDQAEHIIGYLMRHLNSLSRQFQEDPNGFEPLLVVDLDEDKNPVTIADFWCMGFMDGVNLAYHAWAETENVLLPMMMFTMVPGDAEIDDELENNRNFWIEQIAPAVIALHKHWLQRRGEQGAMEENTYVRMEPKVGRNEPCTCGSGRKYKKCCGLH